MSITSVVNDTLTRESTYNAQKPLAPTISGYVIDTLDDTALDPSGGQTILINGEGFLPGATISFSGNTVSSVTFVSAYQLSFTSPAKSAGTYTIYVVNPDGGTAVYIPGIIYSTLPTWTTSSGSLGSYYETTNISNTLVASGDAPIVYSLESGSLPSGSTLYANGVISGTSPVDGSSTTYSFTVKATDAQNQDSTRSFSITINTDVVTWSSPSNNTIYTNLPNVPISNITLSATSAAGYGVVYTANSLPTGVSLNGDIISGTPTVIANTDTLLTATANTTNRSATRTISWVINIVGDAYFNSVSLLIPETTTTFVDDASTNNYAVTISGDTKPSNFNPYTPGYYSNYFDGSGDFLQTSYLSSLNPGANDFTIEFWAYATATNRQDWFNLQASSGFNRILLYYTGSAIQYDAGVGSAANSKISYSLAGSSLINRWYHIALSRSGGSSRLFVNGIQVGSTFADTQVWTNNLQLTIGKDPGGTTQITGFMSNVRYVIGTGVYTSNFTPPVAPLTAISGTALLTCQSYTIADSSANNISLTRNGDVRIDGFDPFEPATEFAGRGSAYFDGTGDYLTVPYSTTAFDWWTSDYTIEAWVYPTSFTGWSYLDGANIKPTLIGNKAVSTTEHYWGFGLNTSGNVYFAYYNGSSQGAGTSSTATLNAWNHIAFVKSGTSLVLYLNGVGTSIGSFSGNSLSGTGQPLTIGVGNSAYINGYVSNLRIVKGTAVYTSTFTPPTAPLTAISGTSLLTLQYNTPVDNNVFLDSSTNNVLLTRNGNATQGSFSPYADSWSNLFDGTNDALSTPANAAFALGTGAFCIEGWIYNNVLKNYSCLVTTRPNNGSHAAAYHIGWGSDGSGSLYVGSTGYAGWAPGTIKIGVWQHLVCCRNSSNLVSIFVDGVRVGTQTVTTNFTNNILGIGDFPTTQAECINGYISNLRIVKGSSVYDPTQTSITVPTEPLISISGTSILTCQSNRFVDNSPNNFTLTRVNDVKVEKFDPFGLQSATVPQSYSVYFDGSGDYLSVPSNSAFAFGNGNLTVECWVYVTSTPSNMPIIGWATGSNKILRLNSSNLNFEANDPSGVSLTVAFPSSLTLNVWNHIALVRSGNSLFAYLNGVSGSATSYTGNWGNSTDALNIGYKSDPTYFNGYISNLRLVKGQALYTTTFTPSTTPLTTTSQGATASNVSLLTCQSATFIDNSTNNFTITAAGNSTPSQVNPFGYTSGTKTEYTPSVYGGSMYFDGNADSLTISNSTIALGTSNFTVEAWVYTSLTSATQCVYDTRNNNGSTTGFFFGLTGSNTLLFYTSATSVITAGSIPSNTWSHIALTRVGNTFTIYQNGVSVGTASNSNNFTNTIAQIGSSSTVTSSSVNHFNGYISDLRVVKGVAIYTGNFAPPISTLQAIQNTILLAKGSDAGIYDASGCNVFESVGNAKISTAINKFGKSSVYFDGTGDTLLLPYRKSLHLVKDFTIEFWIYVVTGGGNILNFGGGSNIAWASYAISMSGNDIFFFGSSANNGYDIGAEGGAAGKIGTLTNGTWTHIAVTRSGNVYRGFINGVQGYTQTLALTPFDPVTRGLAIGANYATTWGTGTPVNSINSYLSDLRITNGFARYTGNFTPPSESLKK